MSSPKGEYIIFGHTRLLHVCLMALLWEESVLQVYSACIITNIDKNK